MLDPEVAQNEVCSEIPGGSCAWTHGDSCGWTDETCDVFGEELPTPRPAMEISHDVLCVEAPGWCAELLEGWSLPRSPQPLVPAYAPDDADWCRRLGVTLGADTRGCTLPAGHGGHHECYGDRLWGVGGWGSDEASDYRRELDCEDARHGGEDVEEDEAPPGGDSGAGVEVPTLYCGVCGGLVQDDSCGWCKQPLRDITKERARQDELWGPHQTHPDMPSTTPLLLQLLPLPAAAQVQTQNAADARAGELSWFMIALEELLDAAETASPAELRAELVQLAAVAVAWIEAIDERG